MRYEKQKMPFNNDIRHWRVIHTPPGVTRLGLLHVVTHGDADTKFLIQVGFFVHLPGPDWTTITPFIPVCFLS